MTAARPSARTEAFHCSKDVTVTEHSPLPPEPTTTTAGRTVGALRRGRWRSTPMIASSRRRWISALLGGSLSLIPSKRNGKYIAFAANEQPVDSAGTVVDTTLRMDLANGASGPGSGLRPVSGGRSS